MTVSFKPTYLLIFLLLMFVPSRAMPQSGGTLIIATDTTWKVDGGPSAALVSCIHPYWMHANELSSAQWIWSQPCTAADNESHVFSRMFGATDRGSTFRLDIAVDNGALITINGSEVGKVEGFSTATALDVSRFIHAGSNTISIKVENYPGCGSFSCNPAGVLARLVATGSDKEFLRIDRADIATKTIVARAAAKVKAEVVALARRKEQLEEEIPELEKRAQQVLVPNDGALVAQLSQRLADTQYALGKLDAVMPSEVRDRVANRRSVQAQLDAVDARLATARKNSPGDVQRLLNQSGGLWRSLRELDDQIAAALRTLQLDEVWQKWAASARLVSDTLSDLRDNRAKREAEQAAAESALREALVQRDQADQRLTEIAELLSLDLRSITVEADGTPVFKAVTTVSLTELDDLNRRIADTSQGLSLLDVERAQARLDFLEAGKAASEALTKVESTIMKVAIGKAAIDGGFFLADVAKSGAKGGLFGVIAELGKKGLEIVLLDQAWPKDSGVDPSSIEGEVNLAFGAGMKDALSAPEIQRTAEERVLKETVFKAGKDKLNQVLERSVFDKADYAWRYRYVVQRPRPPRAADLATYFSVRDKLKKAREIMKGPAYKPNVTGVAESLIKDLAKTGLKAALDAVEHDAWVQYFEKEVVARTYYPLFAAASGAYWAAHDEKERLEYKKAEFLAAAGGEAVKTTLSHSFRNSAKLTIRLEFGGKSSPEIDALVGGAKTAPAGPLTYQLDSGTLAKKSGTVQMELR